MHPWKIGIVGGSGYIGSALAKHLSSSFLVKIIDVVEPRHLDNNIIFERCDIRQQKDMENALRDIDLVIHTAIVQIPKINEQKRLAYEVNILGTQNVCEVVHKIPKIKGVILASSWHTIGEIELKGTINEEFGFRPDKVEDRARLYALSKIAQEVVVRYYDEMSEKIFGVIRMGTVLGEGMPEKTAASLFIESGLKGKPITPFKHSMFRPMLYVDILDVCKAYENFSIKILRDEIRKQSNSLTHIVNVYYPEPVTILELAEIIRDSIITHSHGMIQPKIEIVDIGQPSLFDSEDEKKIKVDINKVVSFLGLDKLKSPRESIDGIVRSRIGNCI
ncbi:MAG: NAD(P)-dependent oxidoreductase [Candidatus Methanomethylicia archaeon]|nr:NAD(P)-dependent oxidoreductase [Candidatus Methanomethylicia archaeon]